MKHPAFRVAAWQWVEPSYQRLVAEAIVERAIPTLPFRPVRVELVGSMVRGCAHVNSDLDLNLAAHDWTVQVEWRRFWANPAHRQRFLAALQEVIEPLGLAIDVAPNNPDQYTYDSCYDFLTGAPSDVLRPFPDLTSRAWDGYEFRWLPVPLRHKSFQVTPDAWAEQVPIWRERYGERFLEWAGAVGSESLAPTTTAPRA